MAAPGSLVVLGVDENREAQKALAESFNAQGLFYRFVTDRKKVLGGVKQLQPQLIVLVGALESDFVIQVLDTLASDAATAQRPVVVVSDDLTDAPFVQGMRTGVVALLKAPLGTGSPAHLRALWDELGGRTGNASGTADSATLKHFIEHIRRTRRSGVLVTNPRTPNEGKASFVYGRLDKASFLGANGQDAVNSMLGQFQMRWSFSEVAGSRGEGAGVVIEVGDVVTGETEVAEVVVEPEGAADEPLAFEMPRATAPVAPSPAPSEATPPQLLFVDDDPAILKMFSTLFAKHGFAVTTGTDGEEGYQLALQRGFDAALADLNMPHLDGWGMLRALRDDFRTRELPIAFLSAHDDYRESLRALDAGAQAYLSKGTKLDVIVQNVLKLLEPRRTFQAMAEMGRLEGFSVQAIGPQWLLKTIAQRRMTGQLTCRDGWANYTLGFRDGVCFHASAIAGKYTAEAEKAFNAFVASRAGEGSFELQASPPQLNQNLFLPTEVLVERACTTLNENEARLRESLMVTATQIDVNPELYAVYVAVGPRQWLEAARLICEEKLPPRDVIARLDLSPIEIEECMKDLIRRGVVTLKRG